MSSRVPPRALASLLADVLRHERHHGVRLGQSVSTAGVLTVVLLEWLLRAGGYGTGLFAVALVALLACAVAAFVVPWRRLPAYATLALPLLTIALIGVLHARGPDGTAVSVMCVLPAAWMGLQFRWRGAAAATLTSSVVAVDSIWATAGDTRISLIGDAVIPVVVFLVAAVSAVTHDLWDERETRLQATGRELAATVAKEQASGDLLRAIFETVDAGLLVVAPDGRFSQMNASMKKLRSDVGGDGSDRAGAFLDVWRADRATPVPRDRTPSARAARGESFHDETHWFGPAGHLQKAGKVSARPIVGGDGTSRGALLVYQDVTDLMVALQAKDEFVASVSHELRTPLTSIIGYVELMEDGPDLPATVRHQLDVVGRNAERLLALVTDLLTVAQAEGGTMRVSPVESDLGEIVSRSMLSAQLRADAQGVALVTDLAPIARFPLDPGRIAQVVDNLVSNAIKYTPGGGTVTATVRPDDDQAVISIADTGIGIAEHERGELFTKFFRSRSVERTAIPGVGLGLVITKAIVDRHAGQIDVVSRLGHGTTVTVRLPR